MTETQTTPPPPTPTPDARSFFQAVVDLSTLRPPPTPSDLPPALERLGPSPFPKSRFRFLSFLATVYDHVSARVAPAVPPVESPGEPEHN